MVPLAGDQSYRFATLPILMWLLASVGGCALLGVGNQVARLEALSHVEGTVDTKYESSGPLIVVLIRAEDGELSIADHLVRPRSGAWHFVVTPGLYQIAAFEDVNRDLKYQFGEPAVPPRDGGTIELSAGQTVSGVAIDIALDTPIKPTEEIDIAGLQARSVADQKRASLGALTVEGEVIELSNPRFDPEVGQYGMWRPVDFMLDHGAGVYFLEAYDHTKTPVLFVHGMTGSPREFDFLVEGLDRSRFQPWFYHYPSGIALDSVSTHLTNIMVALQTRHSLDSLAIVAHSMGGLVAHAFIAKYAAATGEEIPIFVTVSTPFGGHESAQLAVDTGPIPVVPSWIDMAPGSDFIESLFHQAIPATATDVASALPAATLHYVLFGYRKDAGSSGMSGDKVVSVASELRTEAQARAERIIGFDEDHTSILRSAEVSATLKQILDEPRDPGLLGTVQKVLTAPLDIDLSGLPTF